MQFDPLITDDRQTCWQINFITSSDQIYTEYLCTVMILNTHTKKNITTNVADSGETIYIHGELVGRFPPGQLVSPLTYLYNQHRSTFQCKNRIT